MRDIVRLDDYRTDQTAPAERADPAPPAVPTRRPGLPKRGDENRGGPTDRHMPSEPDPLWREVLGERLRAHRQERGATLTRTADRAGISPQYLSEMERGLKEPSSEMIAAVAGALGLTLTDLVGDVARRLATAPGRVAPRSPQLLAMAA